MRLDMVEGGAYLLHLKLSRSLKLVAGALKEIGLPAGHYVYVGSARRGIAARVARHKRLADSKNGRVRWHIDYVLVHPDVRLTATEVLSGHKECDVSRQLARRKGVRVPTPGFGATDCRSGCEAHLYKIG